VLSQCVDVEGSAIERTRDKDRCQTCCRGHVEALGRGEVEAFTDPRHRVVFMPERGPAGDSVEITECDATLVCMGDDAGGRSGGEQLVDHERADGHACEAAGGGSFEHSREAERPQPTRPKDEVRRRRRSFCPT
jgi:hypothetical protein